MTRGAALFSDDADALSRLLSGALGLLDVVDPGDIATRMLRALDEEDEEDEEVSALIAALEAYERSQRKFNADQPRVPGGHKAGGRWTKSLFGRIVDALESWGRGDGPDDPLEGFNLSRDHLLRAAKLRGVELRRGATGAEIRKAILDDVRVKAHAGRDQSKSPDKKTAPASDPDDAGPLTGSEAYKSVRVGYTRAGGLRPRPKGLTREQVENAESALMVYQGASSGDIQAHLRGTGSDRGFTGRTAASIQAAMDASGIDHDIVVFRGVRQPETVFPAMGAQYGDGDLTGVTLTEKGFLSTSTRRRIGREFADQSTTGGGVLLEIRLPAGTGAIRLGGARENEVLAESGLHLTVVEDRGMVDGQRHLVVEASGSSERGGSKPAAKSAPAKPASDTDGSDSVTPSAKKTAKKAAIAPAAADTSTPSTKVRVKGRDLTQDLDYDALANAVGPDPDQDPILAQIWEIQGFNGPPQEVGDAEWDKARSEGGTALYRGVQSLGEGPSAEEIVASYRTGDHYAGRGVFGHGSYFSDSQQTATDYSTGELAGQWAVGQNTGSAVLEVMLLPGARVVEYKDLKRLREEQTGVAVGGPGWGTGDPRVRVLADQGRWASAAGYDVIHIGTAMPGYGDEYIVLNRTATAVRAPGGGEPGPRKFNPDQPRIPGGPGGGRWMSVLSPPTGRFRILRDSGRSGNGHPFPGLWGRYGAAGVLVKAPDRDGQTRYLMVQRGEYLSNGGKWQLPGGALDSKENAYEGAAREMHEEVGARVSYVEGMAPIGETVFEHPTGWKYTTIAATAPHTFPPRVDGGETQAARWMTEAEIAKLVEDRDIHPALAATIMPIINSYPEQAAPRSAYDGEWLVGHLAALAHGASARAAVTLDDDDDVTLDGLPDDDEDGPMDAETTELLEILEEFENTFEGEFVETVRKFNPTQHPRIPAGKAGGGRFMSVATRITNALNAYAAGGTADPFAGFTREQLRQAAKARGIVLKRGAPESDIKLELLTHVKKGTQASQAAKATGVDAGDFTGLTQIGPQGGSNPGGIFQAPDGRKYYVKAASSEQWAREQQLTAKLYELAGAKSPQIVVGTGTPGLPGGWHTATEIVPGITAGSGTKYTKAVQEDFAADAWLADWDVGQTGNIMAGPNGEALRMDIGGSLRFRARGGAKGAAFGAVVGEWTSMRDPKNIAGSLFARMTPDDLADSGDKVTAVDDAAIRAAVKDAGLDSALAALIIMRRDDITARVKAIRAAKNGKAVVGRDMITGDLGVGLAARVAQRQKRGGTVASPLPDASDLMLRLIADEQGFSGPPQLMAAPAIGKLGKAGTHEVVSRGVRGSRGGKSGKQIQDEMRTGNAHYGTGIYGNGYYFSTNPMTARSYSDSKAGSTIRGAVPKGAKIVEYSVIQAEWQKFHASFPSSDPRATVFADVGRYAMARGYDFIQVDQGSRRMGNRPETYYVVLNRTAMVLTQ